MNMAMELLVKVDMTETEPEVGQMHAVFSIVPVE